MDTQEGWLRLGLPKGRMQDAVLRLLSEAGMPVHSGERDYRPRSSHVGLDVKIMKPQSILELLAAGSRDLGFAGADWAEELGLGSRLVELLDTGLDPVRIVAAAPAATLEEGRMPARALTVASEYANLAAAWIGRRGAGDRFVRSYGATEVFPPEDSDCIIDNCATGSTLRSNGLVIVDELFKSSTRLYASKASMQRPGVRESIEHFALLVESVLEARDRVLLELNVAPERIDALIAILPAMKAPTVSRLRGGLGYAVKIAAPRARLPGLIRQIRERGGTDIVVSSPTQIVP